MNVANLFKSVFVAGALAVSSLSFAVNIDHNADANDIAIGGYDTVAYFTENRALEGSSKYTATYKNAIYQFNSAANRDAFRANPEKYAPQFGGFCAMGVALERKFDVDPTAFKIVKNKLYLNLNSDVQKKWSEDINGNVKTAHGNWNDIKTKTDEQLKDA